MKYLYLNDLPELLGKSWSFCQKEINVWRLHAEKKYHLGKLRYLITEGDLIDYVEKNQDRVGNINDYKIKELSFDLNEVKSITRDKEDFIPTRETTHIIQNNKTEENKNLPSNSSVKEVQELIEDFKWNLNNTLTEVSNLIKWLQNNWQAIWSNDQIIDLLKESIEKLEKREEKIENEYKLRLEKEELDNKELNDKLFEEKGKVEKFIIASERLNKISDDNLVVVQKLIELMKMLSWWEKLKIWEFVKIIQSLSKGERLEIWPNWDIKLLSEWNLFLNETIEIDDNLVLEKSREEEIEQNKIENRKLKRRIKIYLFWMIFTIIILLTLVILRFYKII